jgi:hypothetical protein
VSLLTGDREGVVDLQATLAASSAAEAWDPFVLPHHPITCTGTLSYGDDGSFCCEHSAAPPGDVRTRLCVDHSIALLLIELSQHL